MYAAAGGVITSQASSATATSSGSVGVVVGGGVGRASTSNRSTSGCAGGGGAPRRAQEGGESLDAVDLTALNVLVDQASSRAGAAAAATTAAGSSSGGSRMAAAAAMANSKPVGGEERKSGNSSGSLPMGSPTTTVPWQQQRQQQQWQQQRVFSNQSDGGDGGSTTFDAQRRQYPYQQQQQHHHHPSTTHPMPSHPAARPIPSSAAAAASPNKQIFCLGTIMVRPADTTRWGLYISLFDDSYLILGRVDTSLVRAVTVWSRVVSQMPEAAVVITSSGDTGTAPVGGSKGGGGLEGSESFGNVERYKFQRTFEALPPVSTHTTTALSAGGGLNLSAPHLQAGDLILSINGRAVSSFASLGSITSYLRQSASISVVALRQYDALCASAAALVARPAHPSGGGGGRRTDGTGESATAAYGALRRVLSPEAPWVVPTGRSTLGGGGGRGDNAAQTRGRAPAPTSASATAAAAAFASRSKEPAPTPLTTGPRHVPITANYNAWLDNKKVVMRRIRLGNKRRREWEARARARTVTAAAQQQQQQQQQQQLQRGRPHHRPMSAYEFQLVMADTRPLTNPLYRDANGNPILYYDNDDVDPDDGTRARLFLNPDVETNFYGWLKARKETWRRQPRWPVRTRMLGGAGAAGWGGRGRVCDSDDGDGVVVNREFWLSQGYSTFHDWLEARTAKWRQGYSWHRNKRRKLERVSEEVVRLPSAVAVANGHIDADEAREQFRRWLQVRKSQWRILTRKRQRRLAEDALEAEASSRKKGICPDSDGSGSRSLSEDGPESEGGSSPPSIAASIHGKASGSRSPNSVTVPRPYLANSRSTSSDVVLIDAILEEEELRKKELEDRPPLDISFVFDAKLGAPDDAVTNIMEFLPVSEHWKLLCVSYTTSMAIREREYMWRALCPSHWTLPRRPRVPWYRLYTTKIRHEEEVARKQSDGILLKAAALIEKGDHIGKVEKLIKSAQEKFGYSIDYTSGVVMERNSILNLAVINRRHKIARWLLESMDANVETCDRGNFTPLLNAAWEGDKYIVRFLLARGANRAVVGTQHSSQALAHPDFKGLTAEGWARKRGHPDLAELIRLGL